MASTRVKAARFLRRNSIGLLALFIALGGTSYAAAVNLPKNSVGTAQIKTHAVTATDIKADAITTSKIKNGSVQAGDLKPGVIPVVPATATPTDGSVTASKLGKLPAVRVSPTNSFTQAIATSATLGGSNPALLDLGTSTSFNNGFTVGTTAFGGPATALKIPVSGVYNISAGIRWEANAAGVRLAGFVTNTGTNAAASTVPSAGATNVTRQNLSTSLYLTAGSEVYLYVGQDSGGPLNVTQSQGTTHFAAVLQTP